MRATTNCLQQPSRTAGRMSFFRQTFPASNVRISKWKKSIAMDLLPDLIANFEAWEKERYDASRGLFWQIDDRDGMEVSVCGSGYRATINSYMAAEAKAIAMIAGLSRRPEARMYIEKD